MNASDFTNTDACESEKERVFSVKSLDLRNIAMFCVKYSSKIIHFLQAMYSAGIYAFIPNFLTKIR